MIEIISSKAATKEDMLAFIKTRKKEFFPKAISSWGERAIWTGSGTTGWQVYVKAEYMVRNPQYGDELMAIGRAIQHWFNLEVLSRVDLISLLIKLHTRYSARIHQRWEVDKTRPTYFNLTFQMKELLARGFIHYKDLKAERTDWIVASRMHRLAYQIASKEKVDAEGLNDSHGMVEITEVIQAREMRSKLYKTT